MQMIARRDHIPWQCDMTADMKAEDSYKSQHIIASVFLYKQSMLCICQYIIPIFLFISISSQF